MKRSRLAEIYWVFREVSDADMKEYFEFLDDLEKRGALRGRFSAPYHLELRFGLSERDASKLYELWAKTYSRGKSVEQRVLDADHDDDENI